jgi:hypothetical protein
LLPLRCLTCERTLRDPQGGEDVDPEFASVLASIRLSTHANALNQVFPTVREKKFAGHWSSLNAGFIGLTRYLNIRRRCHAGQGLIGMSIGASGNTSYFLLMLWGANE